MRIVALMLVVGIPSGLVALPDPLSFVCDRTVVEVGRERVIAFRSAANASDTSFGCDVDDAEILAIATPPTILLGETLGYLRVQGKRTGETTLRIGKASMKIAVIERRCTFPDPRPVINWPVTGCRVWDTFEVGVEVDREALRDKDRVELRLANDKVIAPHTSTTPTSGPTLRFAFTVDAVAQPVGWLALVAVVEGEDGRKRQSEPVHVCVLHPKEVMRLEAEAEEVSGIERASDARASGEEYVLLGDVVPSFSIPVEKAGWYQVVACARGTYAVGAWPLLGVCIDDGGDPVTNGSLVTDRWHRIPCGVPIRLEAGRRILSVRATNDFYVNASTLRQAHLDAVEVVRLSNSEAPTGDEVNALMVGGTMVGTGGMACGEAAGTARPDLVHVAFAEPLDGRRVQGDLVVAGTCRWLGMNTGAPPRVTLMLNGRPAGTQRVANPYYIIDAAAFVEGLNTLQLVAEVDGGSHATPVQTVIRPALKRTQKRSPRRYERFSVHDFLLDETARSQLGPTESAPGDRMMRLAGGHKVRLSLPKELVGNFLLMLEASAEESAVVRVTLDAGGPPIEVGELDIPDHMNAHHIGTVELSPGAKTLEVFLEEGELSLQSLIVHECEERPDETPPEAKLIWPPNGHDCWRADAVVAEAADDSAIAWAELLIDGRPEGLQTDLYGRSGPIVFPLLVRSLSPGRHTLSVSVADPAGHETSTEPVSIRVLDKPSATPGQYDRAIHLLNRFAFGPEPGELAALLTMGEVAWLQDRLSRAADDPGELAAWDRALQAAPRDAEGGFNVMARVLHHALLSPNPVRTRFVHWVDNHFSTWIRKVEGDLKWDEHRTFARLGAAPFRELLFASAYSPAMLHYLDQVTSFSTGLNENYAREVMELHTVGVHGGYTQTDVTTLARLLTGWTYAVDADGRPGYETGRAAFRFEPALHINQSERFLGMLYPRALPSARYDRPRHALEQLLSHPSTAQFIAKKLVEHYVGVPAPEELVGDLCRVFLETEGDMKEMLLALARHPAFFSQRREKIARPTDWAIRLARIGDRAMAGDVEEFLNRCGMGLFDRPTPDGWPEEDAAWTSTNALLQRWRFARDFDESLASVVPPTWREEEAPVTAEFLQRLVDLLAVRFTGHVLSDRSNRAALEVLAATEGNRDELARTAATVVAQLPEVAVR